MDESTVIDMVISHDKTLDSLSNSINTLAKTTETTNTKLDKVIDSLGVQSVLIERMNNMDEQARPRPSQA